MNIAVYDHCPDIPGRLRQRGDEILGHGVTNSEGRGICPRRPGAR